MMDVQSQYDVRNVYLNQVGIRDLHLPLKIQTKDGGFLGVDAKIDLSVDLDGEQRGTHMSRFIELMQDNTVLKLSEIKHMLMELKEKMGAQRAYTSIGFTYFIKKKSPVSGISSFLDVKVVFSAKLEKELSFTLVVTVPVTTLCPCSKEISSYGAHNQRANVTLKLTTRRFIWIEDVVELVEACASSPVYSLLKRTDEKFVTEQAYDNPRFVEDVAREVKIRVDELKGVHGYEINVESIESIHNHTAYARIIG